MYDLDEVLSQDNTEIIKLEFNSDNSQETLENINKDVLKEDHVEITHQESEQGESIVLHDTDTQRSDFYEYMMKGDGSVICKLCGEVLQSRSHWYRHKYKRHAAHQSLCPAPLYQCEQCLAFFKTKKGYIGHVASRHSVPLCDIQPPLKLAPEDIPSMGNVASNRQDINEDLEVSIPKNAVPNLNAKPEKKNSRCKAEPVLSNEDIEKRRIREERLVAKIIDRVKKECDAQGATTYARRGYMKRTTVMDVQ